MRFPHEPVTVKTLALHYVTAVAGRRKAHESKSGDLPEVREFFAWERPSGKKGT